MLASKQHKEFLNLLLSQNGQLNKLYGAMAGDLASIFKRYKITDKSVWFKNAEVKKEVDALMQKYQKVYFNYITSNIEKSYQLANNHNDDFVNRYTKGIAIPETVKQTYFHRNSAAVQAFINRGKKGFTLSDRVWNLTNQTKDQLEYFLNEGLTDGRSAVKIAGDLKQYLKEPEKRFRRIKDKETGKLKLSEPAKNYHPGQGVYRSSYKNALRLARNEVNIAYRTADNERRKQLPFVVGVKVNLSPSHPAYDICDELQGEYPTNFNFVGWHPNCLCYTTSKLLSKEDFIKHLKGEGIAKNKYVNTIPTTANKFINDNATKLKGLKNKPYFLVDNFKNTKNGFELKSGVINSIDKPATPKAIPVKTIEKIAHKVEGFVPAKNIIDAESRIRNNGVINVSLKGLKIDEFNAVLKAIEEENAFSKLKLDSLTTYRSSGSNALALFSPSNNSISINLSHINKFIKREVISYENQLTDINKVIDSFKSDYLGNPKFKQTTVHSRLNSLRNRIFNIKQKIKNKETARPWSVSSTADDKNISLKSTIHHEIGHYRHYKQLEESNYFRFSERLSVSEYGRTNPKEYFAEWYSYFRINGDENVPEDLLKLFKILKND